MKSFAESGEGRSQVSANDWSKYYSASAGSCTRNRPSSVERKANAAVSHDAPGRRAGSSDSDTESSDDSEAETYQMGLVRFSLQFLRSPPEREQMLREFARDGRYTCVRMLLAEGVNPDAPSPSENRLTAAEFAVRAGRTKCLRLLLNAGANPRVVCPNFKDTLLHIAARSAYYNCVRLLLNVGLDPNAQELEGETPLHEAARYTEANAMVAYFNAGANPGEKDSKGRLKHKVPPVLAAERCARALLAGGASRDVRNKFGLRPIDVAATASMRIILQDDASSELKEISIPLEAMRIRQTETADYSASEKDQTQKRDQNITHKK